MRHRSVVTGALALVVASCAALTLAGCTPASSAASDYSQRVSWHACGQGGAKCATIQVPLDWSKPDGTQIHVAVAEVAATGKRYGAIVMDPGGPGASGVDYVRDAPGSIVDPAVQEHYDIIGLDQRGVGQASAVDCYSQSQLAHYYFDDKPGPVESPAWVDATIAANGKLAAACLARSGPLVMHDDTASAARDLDVVRTAVGDAKLDYLGYSYGSDLGLEYARLFPKNVGRFVLDSVDPPTLTGEQFDVQQASGFEDVLKQYLGFCLSQPACPFTGTVQDATNGVTALLSQVERHPLPDGDRSLNADDLVTALDEALYSTQLWTPLTQALDDVKSGDPTAAFDLADEYYERADDGTYPNLIEDFLVTTCADHSFPETPSAMAAEADEINRAAPVLGPYAGYTGTACAKLPHHPVNHSPVVAEGSDPIVLVSATHDPATPHSWAVEVEKQLANGYLITRDGSGHGSYPGISSCVDKAVDAYFVNGAVPSSRNVSCPTD